jgi:hypothetical protein
MKGVACGSLPFCRVEAKWAKTDADGGADARKKGLVGFVTGRKAPEIPVRKPTGQGDQNL